MSPSHPPYSPPRWSQSMELISLCYADLPVLCSCFPLAIYFTFGSVYMFMPLSHFVPSYPSPSPCPQVHDLGFLLKLHSAKIGTEVQCQSLVEKRVQRSLAKVWSRSVFVKGSSITLQKSLQRTQSSSTQSNQFSGPTILPLLFCSKRDRGWDR